MQSINGEYLKNWVHWLHLLYYGVAKGICIKILYENSVSHVCLCKGRGAKIGF